MKILYSSWGEVADPEVKDFEKLGHEVTLIDHTKSLKMDSWSYIKVCKRLKNYKNDLDLLDLYKNIKKLSDQHDVFIVHHGNVYHPSFIKSLNIYKVIVSGDDPESSNYCSKPFVNSFDHAFAWGVNYDENTKVTEKYLEWGAKRVDWWPYGVRDDNFNPNLTSRDIINKRRDIDLVFVGSPWLRHERLAKIKKSFPQMQIYGKGWNWKFLIAKGGIKALILGMYNVKELPRNSLVPLYQRCKIGLNMHLSYGPCNLRTYQIPANGMMQVCDCPEGVDQVFEVDRELITYTSIDEAVNFISYYLENDDERKKIAAAGFERCMKDYLTIKTFSNALSRIKCGMIEEGITETKDGELLY